MVEDYQQQQLTVTVRTVFMITGTGSSGSVGTHSQSDSWAWTLAGVDGLRLARIASSSGLLRMPRSASVRRAAGSA